MVEALERWDINTHRNINYRSFEPILRLIKVAHTPQCQHWAVWALANLTRTDRKTWLFKVFYHLVQHYSFPGKYCVLIEKEGGLDLLEELINSNTSPAPYDKILELASVVRANVNHWRNGQNQSNGSLEIHQQPLDYDG